MAEGQRAGRARGARPASTSTSRAARRCAIDTYEVVESGTRDEIEERALPFRVGEEVLVSIEEPHMYNADDAIARVDSYIVSVAGGGRHVGERRMVRIESVARSAATRLAADRRRARTGEKLESPPSERRRGRRGGRRRSRARSGGGSGQTRAMTMAETYAIVESGGKQYRAEKGATLRRRPGRCRARATRSTCAPVMFRGDDDVVFERRQAREGQGRGRGRRARARREDPRLQVPGEEGLSQARRPPLRADQARGDRGQDADPQAGREEGRREARSRRRAEGGGEEARCEEAGGEEAGREEGAGQEAGGEEARREEAGREGRTKKES